MTTVEVHKKIKIKLGDDIQNAIRKFNELKIISQNPIQLKYESLNPIILSFLSKHNLLKILSENLIHLKF